MKKFLLAACAALVLTGAAQGAELKEYAKVGNWGIYSGADHCAAGGDYQNGTSLIFGVNTDGETWLKVYNDAWKIPAGEYKIGGSIDKVALELTFHADSNGTYLVSAFQMDSDAYNLLTKGARMTLNIGSSTYHYTLKGTSVMVPKLLECIGQVAKAANPFSGQPASSPSNPFRAL
jgi:hypothetical protein